MIKFAILFLVDFVIYKYVGLIPALIGLAIIIYRISNAIGFTRSIQIYKGTDTGYTLSGSSRFSNEMLHFYSKDFRRSKPAKERLSC